jgi:hypothetical protein
MSRTTDPLPYVHALHVVEDRVLCHATRREREASGERSTLTAEHVTCPLCLARLATP